MVRPTALEDAAPLGTWFTNRCCLNFADVWLPYKIRRPTLSLIGTGELDEHSSIFASHEGAAIYDLMFEHCLEVLDEEDRRVIWLESSGWLTDEQIGDVLDITSKSVEYRKSKSRKIILAQPGIRSLRAI